MPLSWAIPLGTSLIGGLLGSEEKTVGKTNPTSQTTVSSGGSSSQQRIDPRMEQAIYGAGGIMPNAAAWYAKNQSGLNDQMVTGMNNQWNQLGSSKQGFDQMQNLGMGLMGGGSAGNPFTGGGGIAPQQMSYKAAEFGNAGANPFTMPAASPAAAMLPSYGGGGYGGGGGGGVGGESGVLGAVMNQMGGMGGGGGNGYWMTDESGDKFWQPTGGGGQQGGQSRYNAPSYDNTMNMPTASTAGYGGYGGYSTAPAYSYPSGGGNQ